jgi:hypothetical protein
MRVIVRSLAVLMVSKYFPLFGCCHLPPMKRSYVRFRVKWSLGPGAMVKTRAFILALEP